MAVTAGTAVAVTPPGQIDALLVELRNEVDRSCCRQCRQQRLFEIAAIEAWTEAWEASR